MVSSGSSRRWAFPLCSLIAVCLQCPQWRVCSSLGAAVYGNYVCKSLTSNSSQPEQIFSKGDFHNAFFSIFQSPKASNWPNHYFPNMECWFNFSAPVGYHIYVEFPLFVIEGDSSSCYFDKDLVMIPTSVGDRLVCGFPSDYGATMTGRGNASVHFRTNRVIEHVGFTGYFWGFEVNASSKLKLHQKRRREVAHHVSVAHKSIGKQYWPRKNVKDEDDDATEELTAEQQHIIQTLRYITLNGRSAIRQIGCTNCRIAHYFSKCDCAGIKCQSPIGGRAG